VPNNASGFVDFADYANANAPEEEARLQEAMAAAEAADFEARNKLKTAGARNYGYDPNRDTDGDITESASYSDYLVAKQQAAKAWSAAQLAIGSDPRLAGLRESMRTKAGVAGKADASADRLGQKESELIDESSRMWNEGKTRYEAYQAQLAQWDQEKKERADAEKKGWSDYLSNLYRAQGGHDGVTYADVKKQRNWNLRGDMPYLDKMMKEKGWTPSAEDVAYFNSTPESRKAEEAKRATTTARAKNAGGGRGGGGGSYKGGAGGTGA
jgi:hypothetical protein